MDFSNHIKFEGNLIKTCPTTITYSGFLFENGSESVSIVYGFGSHWEHTSEIKMEKTENGFTAELNMLGYDLFNCCFKNGNNEWDNNYGGNYVFEVEDFSYEPAFILNEDVITDILNNLFEVNVSEINTSTSIEVEPVVEQTTTVQSIETLEPVEEFEIELETNVSVSIEDSFVTSTDSTSLNQDIEKLFNDIYQPEVQETVEVIETTQTQEITVEENNETTIVENIVVEEEISTVENIVEEIETTIVENIEVAPETTVVENIVEEPVEEKQNLLSDILADHASVQKAEVVEEKVEENGFNMNSLIDEILSPIISSASFEHEDLGEEYSSFQQAESEIDETINSLISDIEKTVESKTQVNYIEENVEESTSTIEEISDVSFNDDEVSLIETLANEARAEIENGTNNTTTALVEVKQASENSFLVSPRSLGKFYMFKKRVKLAVYKLVHSLPKLLSAKFFEDEN